MTSIDILSTDVKIFSRCPFFQTSSGTCGRLLTEKLTIFKSSPPGGTCPSIKSQIICLENSLNVARFPQFFCLSLLLSFSFLENDDDGLSKRQSSSRSAQQEGRVQLSSSTFSASSFFCTGCRTHVTRDDWSGPAHRDPAHALDTDRTCVSLTHALIY